MMRHPVLSLLRQLLPAVLFLAAAVSAATAETGFRTYQDGAGFSCEFPSDWEFAEAVNTDRVFTSPNAVNATIIIQVIDRAITEQRTAEAQLALLKGQIIEAPDGAILSEATAPVADQQAPYLIASYTTPDREGKLRRFRHLQMVAAVPDYFLLMSYSAPDESFDQDLQVFQHCSATLKSDRAASPPPAADSSGVDSGSEPTLVWRHNTDRDFWITVPSIWSKAIDPSDTYTVEMQHPERFEGVYIFVVDMDGASTAKDFANAWEEYVATDIFFMSDRLSVPEADHPGVGLAGVEGVMRQYGGEINGSSVRSLCAYVVNESRAFTVVGYHFLGDEESERRIRAAVESFRLAAP